MSGPHSLHVPRSSRRLGRVTESKQSLLGVFPHARAFNPNPRHPEEGAKEGRIVERVGEGVPAKWRWQETKPSLSGKETVVDHSWGRNLSNLAS
jgi:hypothetical protein